ncbi:MAG: universal stress protein [Deltaproteobacteria bacterium]|nr:universal stress protein [Deltaproteobacteria bacterium]
MRILFAGDEHPYSAFALKELIRLAMNTWADITILGVQAASASPGPVAPALNLALNRYRETFLNSWEGEDSPYALTNWQFEWYPVKEGLWEERLVCKSGRKDFRVHLRIGNPEAAILREAREEGCDLIVLGCASGGDCLWTGAPAVPQRVASDADCSVLLVKEEQPISRILACLDQTYISQESLEILNQMITIHKAQLEVIGVIPQGGVKKEVYTRLIEVGDYYHDRGIDISTRIAEVADLEASITTDGKQDLLALWMGKKSILSRFFPREWVGRLVARSQSSVLVMR